MKAIIPEVLHIIITEAIQPTRDLKKDKVMKFANPMIVTMVLFSVNLVVLRAELISLKIHPNLHLKMHQRILLL